VCCIVTVVDMAFYLNPANRRKAPAPRHAEIKDGLCRLIRQQLGLIA
jgi:hypothetical protein